MIVFVLICEQTDYRHLGLRLVDIIKAGGFVMFFIVFFTPPPCRSLGTTAAAIITLCDIPCALKRLGNPPPRSLAQHVLTRRAWGGFRDHQQNWDAPLSCRNHPLTQIKIFCSLDLAKPLRNVAPILHLLITPPQLCVFVCVCAFSVLQRLKVWCSTSTRPSGASILYIKGVVVGCF